MAARPPAAVVANVVAQLLYSMLAALLCTAAAAAGSAGSGPTTTTTIIEFGTPRLVGSSTNGSTHFWFPNSANRVGEATVVEVTLRDDSCCFKPPLPASTVYLDSGRGFARQWDVPTGGPKFCGRAGITMTDGSLLCRSNTTAVAHNSQTFATWQFWLDASSSRLRAAPSPRLQHFELPPAAIPMTIVQSGSTVNVLEIPGAGLEGGSLLLRVETLCPTRTCANGQEGAWNALYASSDGGAHWHYRSEMPRPPNIGGTSCEYPRIAETQLQLLHQGHHPFALVFISRCHPTPAAMWYEGSSFVKTLSTDGGKSWTAAVKDPQIFAVAPEMQRLTNGRLLLVSGRPSLFLWVSVDATNSGGWSPTSLIAAHNKGVRNPSLQYSETLARMEANADHESRYFGSKACRGDHGRWCTPQGNQSTFFCTAWCETTSYTSLISHGNNTFTVFYDRLGGGWAGPPGVFGNEDHVFAMTFRVKLDDESVEPELDSTIEQQPEWCNSHVGVHSFIVFDYRVMDPKPFASSFHFIWGSKHENVRRWRAANPDIVVGQYMQWNLGDWFARQDSRVNESEILPWLQANHPDWIMYKCDRKTISMHDDKFPLIDVSQAAFVQWQLGLYAGEDSPLIQAGYNAISGDNFLLGLEEHPNHTACGHFSPNGSWVQQYTGHTWDPAWIRDMLQWLKAFYTGLQTIPAKFRPLLILNFDLSWCRQGGCHFDDERVFLVGNYSDGALNKGVFGWDVTGHLWNPQDDGPMVLWKDNLKWADNLQRHGKAYYPIVESLNTSSAVQYVKTEFDAALSPTDWLWYLASYLLAKGNASALYVTPVFPRGATGDTYTYGRVPWFQQRYRAASGIGASEKSLHWHSEFVASRVFSHGFVAANGAAHGTALASVELPDGLEFYDLITNRTVRGTVHVDARNATVLVLKGRSEQKAISVSHKTDDEQLTPSVIPPPAPSMKVPAHVRIMTACGYNATTQAGWSSFGKSRDLQQLINGYVQYGLRGMYRIDDPEYSSIACSKNRSLCTPSAAFGRGAICAFSAKPNSSSSHGGIRLCSKAAGDQTNWDEQTRKMVQLMRPYLLSGALVGLSLGDEQVGSVPSEKSYRLSFADFERWVDLARGLLDELTPHIVRNGHPAPLLYYMEGARVQLWPRIPRNLTHFSVCQYFPKWMYKNLWIKPLVEQHVFPKLGPRTKLLVVPPILASRTGFASTSVFCPNISYNQWLELDRGNMSFYKAWVFNDTRLVGFDAWPLAKNDPQPGALGLGQIPEMLDDVFKPLGEAILRNNRNNQRATERQRDEGGTSFVQ